MNLEDSAIEYLEAGTGPTVLFLPGSFSTPAAWRPVQKLLPPRYRMVSSSLLGYGRTAETRRAGDAGMAHEVRLVQALARRAGGPLHIVAHSFGGSVALAAALSRQVPVASLALFEANPMALLQGQARSHLMAEALQLRARFEAAVRHGEPDAAALVIDYWGGAGAFAGMPDLVQAYCRGTATSNVLDWSSVFDLRAGPADYAALDIPVLLVRGALSNAAMVEMTDVLAAHLPRARPAVVHGASHFLITSHAPHCVELLAPYLAEVTQTH